MTDKQYIFHFENKRINVMKLKIAQILFIASFCTIRAPFPTFAEIPLIDPNIPHGETITYTSRTDDSQ